jgi:hypothetical protein
MERRMKKLALIFAFFLISCTDTDKFNGEKIQKIQIDSISYSYNLYGNFSFESEEYSGGIPLSYIRDCCISDYHWIINGNLDNSENPQLNYGSYSVKLILVDYFGDTVSSSKDFCLNEPLKIDLLSPIDDYLNSSKEPLEFRYRITGWNCMEYRDSVDVFKGDEGENFWRVIVFTEQRADTSEIRRWLEN